MYELALLGGLVLEGPKGPLSGYATQNRQLALLALLGAAGERGLSRDKLCAYLWPESNEASARHSLTDAVYRLRKSLGHDAILGRSVKLRLNPDVIGCDVWAFETAVEVGDLEAAAALYRGPFLDGFHLRESSEFDHWKDGEARRLGSMFEGLMGALATQAEAGGDHAGAVVWWRRLAAHDPFNSRTVVRLMEAQAAAGDPANAVLYAREHAGLLRLELGVEPPEELVDLADRLSGVQAVPDARGDHPRVPKVPRLPLTSPVGGKAATSFGAPWWLVVGLPLAVVGVVTVMWVGERGSPSTGEPGGGDPADAERLAIMPLQSLTVDRDLEVWGQLAADQMGIAIDRAGAIPVVSGTRVREAARALGAEASEISVARRLLASHTIAGTVARTGDLVHFQVELLDVRAGERLVGLEPVVGAVDSVQAVVGRLAEAAAAATVARLDPEATVWGAPSVAHESLPPRVEAYRAYLRAAELGCEGRYAEAIEAGDRALAADPDYVRMRALVGVNYGVSGRSREADSVFSALVPLRNRMTRVERSWHDYWVAYLHGDAVGTGSAAEEAYRIEPTWAGYVAGLEMSQQRRYEEALPRFLATDLDGVCARGWYWFWTAPAGAYHMLGRHEEELVVVRQGLQRLQDHLALMQAVGRALAAMGRLEAVDSILDAMASKPGVDANIQIALVGLELRAHGHSGAAESALARALEGYAPQPPGQNRYNRGRAFYYTGRWADADTLFAALVELNPEARNNLAVLYRGHRGATLARMGRREEAMEIDRWLAAIPEGPGLRGLNRAWRARIAAVLGERDAAVRHFRDALDHRAESGVHGDPAFDGMWGYAPWDALMAPR
jgi:DNA-binding SARP family transcriptional activator/TolB-like protein